MPSFTIRGSTREEAPGQEAISPPCRLSIRAGLRCVGRALRVSLGSSSTRRGNRRAVLYLLQWAGCWSMAI
jgi:hypothetical protein